MDTVWGLVVLGAIVLGLLAVAGLYLSRQRTLTRRVGSFACAFRSAEAVGTASTPGIAQYATGRLVWWRQLSLAPRPAQAWSRAELTLLDRVPGGEVDEHGQPLVVVRCRHREETFVLVMTAGACAGLVSWLEAGPRPVGRVI